MKEGENIIYIYRDYLQIASYDMRQADQTPLTYIIWDPTQPVATRPLALQQNSVWYTYGWDLIRLRVSLRSLATPRQAKNICELYNNTGYILNRYTYTPYGTVTAAGEVDQPVQWSSEMYDTELGLVYYNYRYYNPVNGRWMSRDAAKERYEHNLYRYYLSVNNYDYLGLISLFGQDITPTASTGVSVTGCVPLSAFPLIKICVTGTVSVSLGSCCKNGSKKELLKITAAFGVSAVLMSKYKPFSKSPVPALALGFTGTCPTSSNWSFGGSVKLIATLGFVTVEGGYDFQSGWDLSVSHVWQVALSVAISGELTFSRTALARA